MVRIARGLAVDELLWVSEIDRRLQAIVYTARGRRFSSRVAYAARHSDSLPKSVKQLIAVVMEEAGPLPTVKRLASMLHMSRSQLWNDWRRAAPNGPTLRRFLDWALLLRAVSHKVATVSWTRVAEELEVHEHTLAGMATRLVARRLRDLDASCHPELALRFKRAALDPMQIDPILDQW